MNMNLSTAMSTIEKEEKYMEAPWDSPISGHTTVWGKAFQCFNFHDIFQTLKYGPNYISGRTESSNLSWSFLFYRLTYCEMHVIAFH